MRFQYFVCVFVVLTVAGCSIKSSTHIDGPYYRDSTKYANLMSEPGGFEVHLSYKKDGKTIVISRNPGGNGNNIYNDFSWRVYGSNLVFVEHDPGSYSFRLVVYSEKRNGNVTIEKDFHYWKIIADDEGITCHRYQNGERKENGEQKDDPNPKFFSADYLKSL
jgi:hypothetical protein